MTKPFVCEECGAAFEFTSDKLKHKFEAHYYPRAYGQSEHTFDLRPDSIKIAELERRIAALEAENERLKAGK